jgi:ParB-like nuclease family protein
MIQKVKLSELRPNPYRNLKHYEIDEKRVNALVQSIKACGGAWPRILARKSSNGSYETAFGEHLKAALGQLKISEVEIIVMDLDDASMLKFMANENSETWTGTFLTEMETVESTVKAFARGEIELSETRGGRSGIRTAPSFTVTPSNRETSRFQYTATSVAKFLGWMQPGGDAQSRATDAVTALEYIERGVLTRRHFAGLNNTRAGQLLEETRIANQRAEAELAVGSLDIEKAEHEAQEAAKEAHTKADREHAARLKEVAAQKKKKVKEAATRMRKEIPDAVSKVLKTERKGAREQARRATNAVTERVSTNRNRLPMFEEATKKLCKEIANFIDPLYQKERAQKIKQIIEAQDEAVGEDQLDQLLNLQQCLLGLARRCLTLASQIKRNNNEAKTINHALKALPAE